MTTPAATPGRRPVRYATPADALADVARLRRGYRQVGQWSLPQACQHLAWVMSSNLTPPPPGATEPTAEQVATKAKFFSTVLNGMPEGMPLAPDKAPPTTCGEADIDALAAAFDAVASYPHDAVMVGRCGPVPIAELVDLHLHHAAHHLSFLTPTTVRRTLEYRSPADVADDVQQLRQGYIRSANWTLPQACWHLRTVTETVLARPVTDPTPEQLAARPVMDAVLSGGPLPDGLPIPAELTPPATAGDGEVDAFLALLDGPAASFPPTVMHRLFGPINGGQFATLFLRHCGHHLSHLIPE